MANRSELANAIRALAMDAVQKANSGHPGMPMGMADIAEVLWRKYLRHSPANPSWFNRDRFVLSNGHGSMLLYALLHLTGYDLPIDQIKAFRQLHSKTPGHPEYGLTPGVETTTGPLGQGLANAVGMAIAEQALAAEFNRPDFKLVDHHTYAFVGDGCLMEGISHEACSLAGVLGLGKLIVMYDDNGISIDSDKAHISLWFSDETHKRFEAYGWHVIDGVDGHDPGAVDRAIGEARSITEKPTLICCKTKIGKGSPNKQDTGAAHGAALGEDEVAATRQALGWSHPPFEIPEHIYAAWDARGQGAEYETEWTRLLENYTARFPTEAAEFQRRIKGELPAEWVSERDAVITEVADKAEKLATRKASQNALEAFAPLMPELIGGSADLAGSNLTMWSGSKPVSEGGGNYVFYGVREFGMAAMMNGMALHGGCRPYGGTFLVFSDYCRNALRVAALMGVGSIFVFTHDSIGLGEDGPTHQPIEHAASLRQIPNMDVWRPCDAVETAIAWAMAVERRNGPSSLLLTRQGVPHQQRSTSQIEQVQRGGYILSDVDDPHVIILATGSEVALAMSAQRTLADAGTRARVVSMPSTTVFDRQEQSYSDSVLTPGVPRVAVEAGVTDFWRKYIGLDGAVIGIDRFGESAPGGALYEHFGITADAVVAAVEKTLS
ncbi:MAG: transketolase [Betaproteobacteria bacterium]|nr:MAG: transketolase [Betaproteobacteria bacterium]